MSYAYFQNLAAWNIYHNAVCLANSIPHPGYKASDNTTVMLASCWTNCWVDPIQIKQTGNVTTWVAHVPNADVITYSLTSIPDSAITFDSLTGAISVTVAGTTYIAEPTTITWRKVKPTTWTDPHDGHVYQVT